MTHQPVVPEAAQSPYPLSPPPMADRDATAEVSDPVAREDAGPEEGSLLSRVPASKLGIGAAVGIGSAALVAALLFTKRNGGEKETAQRARRKRAAEESA